jgi:hypothetical protein
MTPMNDSQCHWRTLDGSRHQGMSFFGRQLFNDTVGVIYLKKTRFLKCPLMERGKIFKSINILKSMFLEFRCTKNVHMKYVPIWGFKYVRLS